MGKKIDEMVLEYGKRHISSYHFKEAAEELYKETGQAYISVLVKGYDWRFEKARLWRSLPRADSRGHVDWDERSGVVECPGEIDIGSLLVRCEEVSRQGYYPEPGVQAVIYHMKR